MLRLELLEERDFHKIVEWNSGKSADFLYQWAGPGYEYPITEEKLKRRFVNGANTPGSDTYIFKIVIPDSGDMIGTIEITKVDVKNGFGVIGRFLIGNEVDRGKGYGKLALSKLVEFSFGQLKLESLALKVFDFNEGAIKCYEQVGFKKVKFTDDIRKTEAGSWGVYEMTLTRGAWEALKRTHII